MLELNVVNKLPDNKVLISEKNAKVPNSPVRYYIAGEENADKFVKKRESLNAIDGWQKYMSMALSAVAGILFSTKVKSNALIKGIVGLTSGYGTYLGVEVEKEPEDKPEEKPESDDKD